MFSVGPIVQRAVDRCRLLPTAVLTTDCMFHNVMLSPSPDTPCMPYMATIDP